VCLVTPIGSLGYRFPKLAARIQSPRVARAHGFPRAISGWPARDFFSMDARPWNAIIDQWETRVQESWKRSARSHRGIEATGSRFSVGVIKGAFEANAEVTSGHRSRVRLKGRFFGNLVVDRKGHATPEPLSSHPLGRSSSLLASFSPAVRSFCSAVSAASAGTSHLPAICG